MLSEDNKKNEGARPLGGLQSDANLYAAVSRIIADLSLVQDALEQRIAITSSRKTNPVEIDSLQEQQDPSRSSSAEARRAHGKADSATKISFQLSHPIPGTENRCTKYSKLTIERCEDECSYHVELPLSATLIMQSLAISLIAATPDDGSESSLPTRTVSVDALLEVFDAHGEQLDRHPLENPITPKEIADYVLYLKKKLTPQYAGMVRGKPRSGYYLDVDPKNFLYIGPQ